MSELLVWTTNEVKNPGACQYYRINTPLNKMYDLFGVQSYEDRGENPRESLAAMFHSDIIQYYSLAGESILHRIKTVNGMAPAEKDGVLKVPPAFIYDTDDNADFVHPFNPTFALLGVRAYPDARLLKPGDCLVWDNEVQRGLGCWFDQETKSGPTLFDIGRNLHQMKVRHEIIRSCDGATVSTPALADYFREVVGQKNVYVYPNTIVPEDYPTFSHGRFMKNDPDEIRILWQGSQSHFVDWYPLRHAIREVALKYPKVKWVIFGEYFPFVKAAIPPEQIEHHNWVDYPAYKLYRTILNADINLCPLVDNAFNRCKSAIKWYEGAIMPEPEATLAQNTAPYREIEDGKTGLLFSTPEEFVQKLSLLIEDAQLRKTLGAAAREWVMNNRLPQHTTPGLVEFYEDVRGAQKRRRTGAKSLVVPGTNQDLKRLARVR